VISQAKVKSLRQCASARVQEFIAGNQHIHSVSVAEKDMARAEIAELLKGETPLWPPGSCNQGLEMWKARRAWYPYKVKVIRN
jgi:hypothetical protein